MRSRRTYVDGPFGQIHIRVLGSGPAIVLNHQSGSSSVAFEAVLPKLASAGYQAISIDMPGMGSSDAPQVETWSLDMFADAVAAVIDRLGVGPAIVAGHHTGAGTTLRHAARHPDQVRAIALHQLLMYDAEARAAFAAHPIPSIHAKRDGSHLLQGWNARSAAGGDWQDLEAMNRGVLDLLQASPQVAKSFAAALAYDPAADLQAIRCPVLILSNTGDHNHRFALKLREMRPEFGYAELAGGAIDIMDEQPTDWAAAIAAFARGLER